VSLSVCVYISTMMHDCLLFINIADVAKPVVEPQASGDFPLQKCVSADFQSGSLSVHLSIYNSVTVYNVVYAIAYNNFLLLQIWKMAG